MLIAAWLLTIVVVGVATYYWCMEGVHQAMAVDQSLEPSSDLLEELADLRHLKAQLETPPQEHTHVWARKPVVRKMGWLLYRCSYANCLETQWRRS